MSSMSENWSYLSVVLQILTWKIGRSIRTIVATPNKMKSLRISGPYASFSLGVSLI